MRRSAVIAAMSVMLSVVVPFAPALGEPTEQARRIMLIEKGKEATRAKLLVPRAARFRAVYLNVGKDIPLEVVCGEIASKTAIGADSEFQRFVSNGTSDLTWLEEEVIGFDKVWARLCR